LDSILKSELRVFKYLNYRLNIATPYKFMEVFLQILDNNLRLDEAETETVEFSLNFKKIQVKLLHLIGVKLLERFYYYRDDIYGQLYESIMGRSRHVDIDIDDKQDFFSVENDILYLSASIIVSAGYIYSQNDKQIYEKIIESISTITKLDKADLDEFAVIITHFGLINDKKIVF
jgi:hypothetical protein